jgi:pimeloyl-ACP methyl ester carboxylesterase
LLRGGNVKKMSKATVNDIKLNYFQTGHGPDLVMIHGLGANMAFWYPKVVRFLSGHFRVTIYELRGHGASDMPSSGYTTRDMVEDLRGLMDSLGIENAHLAGHSFGGSVALHMAALHPERVATLTLADAVIKALQTRMTLKDWPYWMDVLKKKYAFLGIELDDGVELDADMLQKLSDPGLAGARQNSRNNDFFLPFGSWNGGKKAATLWQKLVSTTSAKEDFREVAGLTSEEIAGISVPALAVYGENSMFLNILKELDGLVKDLKTVIVPGRGHFHPAIEPEFFAAALKEFIIGNAEEPLYADGANG